MAMVMAHTHKTRTDFNIFQPKFVLIEKFSKTTESIVFDDVSALSTQHQQRQANEGGNDTKF